MASNFQLTVLFNNIIKKGEGAEELRLPASLRQAEASSWYRKQSRKPHGRWDRRCGVTSGAMDKI